MMCPQKYFFFWEKKLPQDLGSTLGTIEKDAGSMWTQFTLVILLIIIIFI